MVYTKKQEFLAEFIGTFFIILLGCGSVAMVTLFPCGMTAIPGEVIKGGYTNVVFGWALAVAFGIIVSVRVSGAHLNPAVSISLAVIGSFPYNKLLHYVLAQILGAMTGALLVFLVFYGKWMEIDPTLSSTQGIMATFPAVAGFWPGFIDQVVGTFVLVFLILSVSRYFKEGANSIAFPFVIGAIVLVIGISLGGMNGYAINPARDLGPRLILLICGFKNTGFNNLSVWIIPIVGPIVGGVMGAIFYNKMFSKVNK